MEMPDDALGVAVVNGYAYVAVRYEGLRVVDVRVPASPTLVGFLKAQGYAAQIATAGGYAFIADDIAGLRVIDISIPSAPTEVAFLETLGSPRGVFATSCSAYVADEWAGTAIIRHCSALFCDGFETGATTTWSQSTR